MIVVLYSEFFERNGVTTPLSFVCGKIHLLLHKGGVLKTKTHQQTKIQNKCSIFCSETIDFKMFIYYTIKQK